MAIPTGSIKGPFMGAASGRGPVRAPTRPMPSRMPMGPRR